MKKTTAAAVLIVLIFSVVGTIPVRAGVCEDDLSDCLDRADNWYYHCTWNYEESVCQWHYQNKISDCFAQYWDCLYG